MPASDHLRLAIRLTPKAGGDRVDGRIRISDGTIAIGARVRADPEDGKANAALMKLVAKALGVSASAVTIAAGHRARLKQLRINGDPRALLD